MACDEYFFAQVISGRVSGLLRLYSWQGEGGITIGRNQDVERAIDHTKLGGIRVIRRITGGRAVYHDPSELTYCIVFDSSQFRALFPSDSIAAVSGSVSQFLRHFVSESGIRTEIASKSTDSGGLPRVQHRAPCFESHARHELVSEGRKVAASAQCRLGSCWLQHGSIKLAGLARHPAVDGESLSLPELSRENFDRAVKQLQASALEVLGLETRRSELTDEAANAVQAIAERIEKKPLEVRQLIKHSHPPDSP